MPTARSVTAPVTPKRQRAPSNRLRKPSAKVLQQDRDDDSDLETITVAAEEDASWTPRRRGEEANSTPPQAEFRRFTREHGKQRNDNTIFTDREESARIEITSGGEGIGTKVDCTIQEKHPLKHTGRALNASRET